MLGSRESLELADFAEGAFEDAFEDALEDALDDALEALEDDDDDFFDVEVRRDIFELFDEIDLDPPMAE